MIFTILALQIAMLVPAVSDTEAVHKQAKNDQR
jgi:hypothetical protein